MSRPVGFNAPKKHRAASVRICVPLALREQYGGRKDYRISLGTGDPATLKARAHSLRAKHESEFAKRLAALQSAQSLKDVGEVLPALREAIAAGVYAECLGQDDTLRDSPELRPALQEVVDAIAARNPLRIPAASRSSELAAASYDDGLSDEQAAVVAGLNASVEAEAAIALARSKLTHVRPLADKVAKAMGLSVDWDSPSGRLALKASLVEQRKAWRDRTRRDAGEAIATPQPAALAEVNEAVRPATLWDVVEAWIQTNSPGRTHISKTRSAVRLVDDCLGARPLKEYSKADGAKVVAHMLANTKAQKTAKDFFDNVKALFNYAEAQLGHLDTNPWKGYSVKVKKSRPRMNLSAEALYMLFDSPLFRSYELPASPLAGGAAAYWVPLLGIYTGARQSELCQLRIEDVTAEVDGGLTMTIVADAGDEDEDSAETTTKGETARRRCPVHRDLIALGFADYLNDIKAAGHTLVFPGVRRAHGEPAGVYFSKWFNVYRKAQGVQKRYQDFHAFRHTSRTRLSDADVPGEMSSLLMGHTLTQNTGRTTYDHSIKSLRDNINRLNYDDLGLRRVYPEKNA